MIIDCCSPLLLLLVRCCEANPPLAPPPPASRCLLDPRLFLWFCLPPTLASCSIVGAEIRSKGNCWRGGLDARSVPAPAHPFNPCATIGFCDNSCAVSCFDWPLTGQIFSTLRVAAKTGFLHTAPLTGQVFSTLRVAAKTGF